jgi:hypothetical protein
MVKGIAAIFEGARAGYYSLPDEVRKANEAASVIEERAGITRREWASKQNLGRYAETQLVDAIIVAARAGQELPNAVTVIEAKHEQGLAQITARAFENAARDARDDVVNLISKHLDEINRALRDAFATTLQDIRKHASELDGIELDPDVVIAAGEKTIASWTALQALAGRFDALRAAQRALNNMRRTTDQHGYFNEFRHPDQFEARQWRNPIERVVAIATSDAGAWIPTIEEQDAAVRDWQTANDPILPAQRRAIERDGEEITV